MIAKLLFRLSTLARPSGQDETGLRHEVCPPPAKRGPTPRPSSRWLDSLSTWWRGSAANAAQGSSTALVAKSAEFLESTQPPDADTRLCPRVIDNAGGTRLRGSSASRLAGRLALAREELSDTLSDLHPDKKRDLQWRIRQAQTLRELWHLRPDVFTVISIERDQREADRRLNAIKRHFPVKAPKSGFGALDRSARP